TRFDVSAYPDDHEARVVVAEGRVALRPAAGAVADRVVLGGGDVGRLGAGGRIAGLRGGAVGHYLAWAGGRVVFEGTPWSEAVSRLGRWYGLRFTLADRALGDKRMSASFQDESAAEVLQLMAATLGVSIVRHGRAVTIQPRH